MFKAGEINHEGHEGHEEFAERKTAASCLSRFGVVFYAVRYERKRLHQSCHVIVTCPTARAPSSLSPLVEFAFMNPAELFRQDAGALGIEQGDFLFREGESGGKMYVLLEGTAEIMVGDLVVEAAGPGALLGEMALIDDSPRTASVVAKTPCRLAQVDRRRFHFLVQQTPHFATHVMKTLADRLRHMNAIAAAR